MLKMQFVVVMAMILTAIDCVWNLLMVVVVIHHLVIAIVVMEAAEVGVEYLGALIIVY